MIMDDSLFFSGVPVKAKIISNDIHYGIPPAPEDEIEQQITINRNGQVRITRYAFGSMSYRGRKRVGTQRKDIGQAAEKLLNYLSFYFSNPYKKIFATDIGQWDLELINSDGETYHYHGSLYGDLEIGDLELSDVIRQILDEDNLLVFDGNRKLDRTEHIMLEYKRVSKRMDKETMTEDCRYAERIHSEKLEIDRKSGTILFQQKNVDGGCMESRYYHTEDVSALLDELQPSMFENVKGDPPDVIDNPMDCREYKLEVEFKRSEPLLLNGTYDRDNLPEDWDEIIFFIRDTLACFGYGEVFNSTLYDKTKRCASDLIILGVEFEEYGKTYSYLTDDDSIRKGDKVVVPVGRAGRKNVAAVVEKEYYRIDDVPMPVEKMKKVIGIYSSVGQTEEK